MLSRNPLKSGIHGILLLFALVLLAGCSSTSESLGQLNYAIMQDDAPAARLQIAEGANVNGVARDGNRPLHSAAYKGNVGIARELVSAGAEVEVADCRGITPLMHASAQGHVAVARFLVDEGANVNRRRGDSSITCQKGSPDDTPLSLASQYNKPDMARFLMEKGARKGSQRALAYALSDPARAPIARQLKAAGITANEETATLVAEISGGNGAGVPGSTGSNANTQTASNTTSDEDSGGGELVEAVADAAVIGTVISVLGGF